MMIRKMLNWIWGVLIAAGLVIAMFGGVSHTVMSPSECPESWEGDEVTFTEVYDTEGGIAGYWCLIEGKIARDGTQEYLSLPVGVKDGYPGWYGFLPILTGVLGIAVSSRFKKPTS